MLTRQKKPKLAALTVISCLALAGCGISPPPDIPPKQSNVASLDPQNWYIFYSADMPSHPSAMADGAWSFDFPTSGHINYVQTPFNTTTTLHMVTLTFRIESGDPQYRVLDPKDILPATVHLFFEQRNDDLVNPNGRWWATFSKYDLGSKDNTTVTFLVPLTPDQWTNVDGEQDPNSFYAAFENIGWIGLTCGGQAFFGHGVALNSGTAKYVLVNLSVS
jgi:predicted small lipoprotein YifL